MIRWPSGFEPDRFLREHWQKTPLLLPGALPDLRCLPSPEELAGLACEPEVESRLVMGDPESGWRVRHGPFEEADFLALPGSRWTLLVQDVEKHLPAVAALLDAFDFIPRWRLDDLMISYAAPGGSVGPHVDAYDVFLVQVEGRRTWELGRSVTQPHHREDSDLKVLSEFEPTTRLRVEPGDVLYVPPGVAHFGHSDQPSTTCSVGFRAPSAGELLVAAARLLDRHTDPMYADPDLTRNEVEGSGISNRALERARRLMQSAVLESASAMEELLGELATEGKPWLLPDPVPETIDMGRVLERLSAGGRLERHPGSRFAWFEGEDRCWLFANGNGWRLPRRAAAFCRRTADGPPIDAGQADIRDPEVSRVLSDLMAAGCLTWTTEEPAEDM
ncbi:MAG: hypothetical protein AMJ59_07810 [Gammaproteobacteria bacterium SG8_31]|nr:MAG: hypothetical protein AMJ59_07810 [Gammaproteobacteria bacterium SG8_31]